MRAFKCHFLARSSKDFGLVWCGLVWSGLVWFGLVWSGNHRASLRMQWKFFPAPAAPAQHFMHVLPIYKSFLFVCLHLACLLPSVCLDLDMVGYVAYT